MPRKELPKPSLASWSIWKSMFGALYLCGLFIFLIWLFNSVLHFYNAGVFSYSLTIKDALLGSSWFLFVLSMRRAWQPRRKHARWQRWLIDLIVAIYGLTFVLSGAVSYWSALLKNPWNWVVNGILIVLFILAWILPVISYPAAKKLVRMQWAFNFRILSYGGLGVLMVLAGILGASFGMSAYRNGEMGSALLVIAFLCSLIAVFGAQYAAERLWPYRPWQKEEE